MTLGIALNEIGLDLIEHFGNDIGAISLSHDLTGKSVKIKMHAEKVIISFHMTILSDLSTSPNAYLNPREGDKHCDIII